MQWLAAGVWKPVYHPLHLAFMTSLDTGQPSTSTHSSANTWAVSQHQVLPNSPRPSRHTPRTHPICHQNSHANFLPPSSRDLHRAPCVRTLQEDHLLLNGRPRAPHSEPAATSRWICQSRLQRHNAGHSPRRPRPPRSTTTRRLLTTGLAQEPPGRRRAEDR